MHFNFSSFFFKSHFFFTVKPKDWNEPYEAMFSDCEEKNCLMFSTEDLCTRIRTDHNYNAICRNLLSHYANENGLEGGFLHSMPVEAEDYWDLGKTKYDQVF